LYLVKRHQKWWAFHDVPTDMQAALGRRLSKSLGTDDRLQAERMASLLWLHDWSRQLRGLAVARSADAEAAFFKDLIRKAETEEERAALIDHVGNIATDRAEKALERDDYASADAAERFAKLATGRLTPLTEHLDEWIAALEDVEKTKSMKRSDIEKLSARFQHVQDVTPNDAKQWLHDITKDGNMSAKTVGRILSFIRGYWRYLIERNVTVADPFAGLSPPSTARRGTRWLPFTPEQVVDLERRALASGDTELADLIDIGKWSGARIEELCSLEVPEVDLKKKRAFQIKDAKTEAGVREVPIHPKLVPTLRRLLGKRTSGYVLADLKPNKYGDRSNAIGKRFGRLKKAAGFGKSHVYHSIRKCASTQLENALVPEGVSADILGHEKPNITYGLYSGGASLEVKRAALEKLTYGQPRATR